MTGLDAVPVTRIPVTCRLTTLGARAPLLLPSGIVEGRKDRLACRDRVVGAPLRCSEEDLDQFVSLSDERVDSFAETEAKSDGHTMVCEALARKLYAVRVAP